MKYNHKPVMADEVIKFLDIKSNGLYIDGTLGGCGHTRLILDKLNAEGRVIGIDRDGEAIKNAAETLNDTRLMLYNGNYYELDTAMNIFGYNHASGILMDLGVSSYQLDNPERGFSYSREAFLDMRMNQNDPLTAFEIVNNYNLSDLERIFNEYGEERFSKRIAERITEKRQLKAINTTLELGNIIASAIPKSVKFDGHPAKRCFQAIRIEVNNELELISGAIKKAIAALEKGGVLAIITFHSLEDRIVKKTFKELESPCQCPKKYPCVCEKTPLVKIITKKAIIPTMQEQIENNRSKSAKLRVCLKI